MGAEPGVGELSTAVHVAEPAPTSRSAPTGAQAAVDRRLVVPSRRHGPGRGDPIPAAEPAHLGPGHLRGGRSAPGGVDHLHRGGPGDRRDRRRSPVPVRGARRPGHAHRTTGPVAPPGAPGGDQPPGVEGGHRPQRRGPRSAANLRPRLSGTGGGGGRRAVVHDGVRTGLPAHRLDGPAGGSRSGPGGAPDAGPVPGERRRSPARRGARSDPARDALRGRRLPVTRRRKHLLRLCRRHPAVRHAARRDAALGCGPGDGRRAPAQRRPGHRVDRTVR